MKKIMIIISLFIISLLIYFNVSKPVIVESFDGLIDYHQLSNGKWQCRDEIYEYQLEFRYPNNDSKYIVLSHNKEVEYSHEQINAAIFSSIIPLQLDGGVAIVVDLK